MDFSGLKKKKKLSRIPGFSCTEMELSIFYSAALTNYNKSPCIGCIMQTSWDSDKHWLNNTRHIWKGNQILKNNPNGSEFPDFFHSISPSSDFWAIQIQGLHSKCRQKMFQERPSLSNQNTRERGPLWDTECSRRGKHHSPTLALPALPWGKPQVGSCVLWIAWAWQQGYLKENTSFFIPKTTGIRRPCGPMFSCDCFMVSHFIFTCMIQLD